jgi:hypothetical protein
LYDKYLQALRIVLRYSISNSIWRFESPYLAGEIMANKNQRKCDRIMGRLPTDTRLVRSEWDRSRACFEVVNSKIADVYNLVNHLSKTNIVNEIR